MKLTTHLHPLLNLSKRGCKPSLLSHILITHGNKLIFISHFYHRCLPDVLYGCETWSLTLRKSQMLRRTLGPKRDEEKGEWRRLHNEELCDLYCSPNIIRVIKTKRM